ncbi:MAG: LacI family DNA-binding transcriptional regulator [Chloroflexi bacterium]|nr:LacI family DNA-binding transcriptional regulator [Chloroflexota bacterium]MBP8054883.1 LacI family DNA-binding transcriptional regulator [Chloroflexota bacterium]
MSDLTMPLTLEEIGRLAGASRSTVSRVINGQRGVREETRQRVLQIVAETGFHPNAAARSLAGHRAQIIGLVIPLSVQFLFTDPYFPRLIQGISQACNQHDYTLSLYLFQTAEEEKTIYSRVLRTGFVDGIIISSTQLDDPLIPQLLEHQIPFSLIGRPENAPSASYVDVDNVEGGFVATTHLIRLGYQRIATITGHLNAVAGVDRYMGYKQALQACGRGLQPHLIANGDFSEAGGYTAMRQLLPHHPDAVFVASDMMALGALRAIQETGLSVPKQIALVGFDDMTPTPMIETPLTTIRQPIRSLGTQAVEMLIDLLNNGLTPPRRQILPTELVIRNSCGAMQQTV